MWASEDKATALRGDILSVYLISKMESVVSAAESPWLHDTWNARFAALKRWCDTHRIPCRSIRPVILSDGQLPMATSHLNAYGQFLFRCKSRSIHMTYSYKGGLGCALAHRNTWKTFIESGARYGLVVEDNVHFGADTDVVLSNFVEGLRTGEGCDYLMMHTLGPFADFCLEAEVGAKTWSTNMLVSDATQSNMANDPIYSILRPMMSTKCYFISRRFAMHMHNVVDQLYRLHEMPPFHIDAWLSLEALRGGFRAFHRSPAIPTSVPWLDNTDGLFNFVSVLKKPSTTGGIEHTTPVCSLGAENGALVKSSEEQRRRVPPDGRW